MSMKGEGSMRIIKSKRMSLSEMKEKILSYARSQGKPFIFPYSQNNHRRFYHNTYTVIVHFLGTKNHDLIRNAVSSLIEEKRLLKSNDRPAIYRLPEWSQGKPSCEVKELWNEEAGTLFSEVISEPEPEKAPELYVEGYKAGAEDMIEFFNKDSQEEKLCRQSLQEELIKKNNHIGELSDRIITLQEKMKVMEIARDKSKTHIQWLHSMNEKLQSEIETLKRQLKPDKEFRAKIRATVGAQLLESLKKSA